MIRSHRFLIAACFAFLLPHAAFSEAPVVDESENYALLDEQQADFDRPVAKAQIDTLDNDEESALARDDIESSRNSNKNNNAVLLDKIQGLQQEVQELRGQLEVQAHDLKLLQQQQLAFYKDLDARLRHEPIKTAKNGAVTDISFNSNDASSNNLAGQSSSTPPTKPAVNVVANRRTHTNPADEQISYLAAYELVKNKHFDEALTAMQSFVTNYPQGGYTANAQYWLGELYMVKKNYPKAIEHFNVVLHQFPSSSKMAASMLKIGYALAASGKAQEAITQLQQVVKNYPDTNTAQLAQAKLDSLT